MFKIAKSRYPSIWMCISPCGCWTEEWINKRLRKNYRSQFSSKEEVNSLRHREHRKGLHSGPAASIWLVCPLHVPSRPDHETLQHWGQQEGKEPGPLVTRVGSLTSTRSHLETFGSVRKWHPLFTLVGFSVMYNQTPDEIQSTKVWAGLFQTRPTGLSCNPVWDGPFSGGCLWSTPAQSSDSSPFPMCYIESELALGWPYHRCWGEEAKNKCVAAINRSKAYFLGNNYDSNNYR